jgi:hypothetical protein
MKPNLLIPAVTAALGFTLAWVAKPGGSTAPGRPQNEVLAPGKSNSTRLVNPSPSRNEKRPQEVKASDFPLADAAELGPKTRDEARMLRLTEALGLSIDQQGDIIKLVEEAQAKVDGNVPVIQDLAQRGKILEDGLAKVLKPEQLAKFQQVRDRERENLLEHRSQKKLNQAIEDIDLSPDQREQVLVRLRQRTRAELQAVPATATLLYGKSMLPTNNKELSVDGVLLLAKINDDPLRGGDPATLQKRVFDSHRRELEEMLTCFDGILTAGQMGQYQAILAESQAIMNQIPDPMPDSTPSEPEPPGPGDRDEEQDQETENP